MASELFQGRHATLASIDTLASGSDPSIISPSSVLLIERRVCLTSLNPIRRVLFSGAL